MKKESTEQELKAISPWLSDLKKQKDGFNVPKDYFEQFESRLMDRIDAHGIQPGRVVAKKSARKLAMYPSVLGMAAAVCLLLGAIWFFYPEPEVEQVYTDTELTDEDIESYLLENIQEFEADQLAMLPDDASLEIVPEPKAPGERTDSLQDILAPEDVESVLDEMTEEELEEIL